MEKTLQDYMNQFDEIYKDLEIIDSNWYENEIGAFANCSKTTKKDKKNNFSEEYIRARFVWSLVNSGKYNKEYICVEFGFPKGNKANPLKPDVVVFKNKDWKEAWEEAKSKNDFSKIRKNVLVIFEAKKNSKDIESAIENQLRSAMELNTSKDRIFGVYFDDKQDVIIFKKIGNSEIRRFYENEEIQQDGLSDWNLENRDALSALPSQQDFIDNNESISDLTKLKFDSLDAIDESNFTELMESLKRKNDSIKPESDQHYLIVEFLTLKVFDEKRAKRDNTNLKFYILPEEKEKDGSGSRSFRVRIQELYKEAEKEYRNVIGGEKRVFSYDSNLRPTRISDEKFLVGLVEAFQRRAILKARNESFNQIIFNNFSDSGVKVDNDQFYTPIPVVKTIIKMINPTKQEEVCDPCCGLCDFPAMAYRHTHDKDEPFPPPATNLFGFDIAKGNIKLAELNLVLNGDGGAVLHEMNSLSQKLMVNDNIIKSGDFNVNNYDPITWSHKSDPNKDIRKFKIITTNPPFGKGRDLKTGANGKWDLPKEVVEMYETYKIKVDPDKNGKVKYPNSMDMGALFLENAYKSLEEGGRMAIVLSNSIASIKEWKNIRKWLIERMRIVALFDLPPNTFGETGVATTVIMAYKPKEHEKETLLNQDYEVFIKDVEKIGYEVKTVKRTIQFQPRFIINDNFEKTNKLDEDFSIMYSDFIEFLKRQEEEIKKAFNLSDI